MIETGQDVLGATPKELGAFMGQLIERFPDMDARSLVARAIVRLGIITSSAVSPDEGRMMDAVASRLIGVLATMGITIEPDTDTSAPGA